MYHPFHHGKVLKQLQQEKSNGKSNQSYLDILSKYQNQIKACLLLSILLPMTGEYALEFYSTQIMTGSEESAHLSNEAVLQIRIVNLLIGFVRLAGSLFGTASVDKLGRKTLYTLSNMILIGSLFSLGLGLEHDWDLISKGSILVFSFGVSIGFALLNPLYFSELLPTKAISPMLLISGVLGMFVTFAFPLLQEVSWIGLEGEFYFFGGFAIFGLAGLFKYLKETKGLSMTEVYEVFRSKEQTSSKELTSKEIKKSISMETLDSQCDSTSTRSRSSDDEESSSLIGESMI